MLQPHRPIFVLLCLLAAAAGLQAQSTWVGGGGNTNLSNAANWNGGIAPANDGTASLIFNGTGSGAINVDTSYSVSSISVSGANIYSFNSNTLSIGSSITDSATNGISINSALALTGTATFTNSSAASNLSLNAVGLGGNALTLTSSNAGSISVNGAITGTGGVTITGGASGLVFFQNTGNTYTGGTTISSGTLQIGNPGMTSNGSIPGDITNNSKLNLKPATGGYTYSGVISGTGQMLKLGTNMLTLNGASTYTGSTFIDQGTVRIGVDNALPATTFLGFNGANSPTLDLQNNQTIDRFNGGSFSGTTISIASGKALTLSRSGSGSSSYDGLITGAGSVVVTGNTSGKVQINGNSNDYTGGTTVNAGQLGIHNTSGSATGTGTVVINNTGRLEGGGYFTGALTLNSGSSVTPDANLRTGAITMNGGATYVWGLADATGTAGTATGLLTITGGLTLSATSGNTIKIMPVTFSGGSFAGTFGGAATNFDPNSNYTWTITTGASSLSGFASNIFSFDTTNFNSFNGVLSVTTSGNDLLLNYTAIPEPALGAIVGGIAALGLGAWRRSRRNVRVEVS